MSDPICGDCGRDEGDNFMECCLKYLCDDCADRHDEKWGRPETPIPYTITPEGRAMLEGK